MILFLIKIAAHEAVFTIAAVGQIRRSRAVSAVEQMMRAVAVFTICAVGHQLTVIQKVAVHAVTAVLTFATVIRIFHKITTRTHVGIFRIGNKRVELRIFVVELKGTRLWHHREQLGKLFKEWPIEIVIPAIRFRIPAVAPPAVRTVNRERCIHIIERENALLAEVTSALVQMRLVAVRKSALQAASRAVRRFRNLYFLIKRTVAVRDFKGLRAVVTGIHRMHLMGPIIRQAKRAASFKAISAQQTCYLFPSCWEKALNWAR